MKYNEALHYLLEQLPMFQRIGAAAYRTDLTNIIRLCDILGNPQQHLNCIHVAGTNGKGSVTHIIASVLQQQGYKVGVFVSPHYKDYRERIKINGKHISRQYVTRFVEQHIDQFKTVNASFFEITTAMAFQYFKDKKVDFAVIETGMGGRLDSTNIITPRLSVITNIGYDHTQFLGNTLAKIAAEKAGIIKPNVPVVIGETNAETKPVFIAKAKAENATLHFADKETPPVNLKTDLKGSYQLRNLRTAGKAIEILQETGVKISASAVKKGVANVCPNTSFIGRWMIRQQKPLVIFDSAHNKDGIVVLKQELKKLRFENLHFVYGTVSDKDYSETLALLPRKAQYYFCKADIPRGLNAETLLTEASKFHLKGKAYSSVKRAFNAAFKNAAKNDLVLVAGSIFIVAELL
ncbi:MAG: bifunctional folylpolyglutamate synthase/dihydrofolate synthase [Chitinophagales bacterium]|nr:bifunctional folylpolyglutamate synthase/dihydrofolate synthase [Chitinophagales bacterium]